MIFTKVLYDAISLEIHYTVISWGAEAQLYGPPEDFDPGEPLELDVEEIYLREGSARIDIDGVIADYTPELGLKIQNWALDHALLARNAADEYFSDPEES